MYYRIRDLRKNRGLTQKDIGKLLNINQSTYSDYETGQTNIPIEALIKLSELYDTSIDYIVEKTDIKESYPKSKRLLNNKK